MVIFLLTANLGRQKHEITPCADDTALSWAVPSKIKGLTVQTFDAAAESQSSQDEQRFCHHQHTFHAPRRKWEWWECVWVIWVNILPYKETRQGSVMMKSFFFSFPLFICTFLLACSAGDSHCSKISNNKLWLCNCTGSIKCDLMDYLFLILLLKHSSLFYLFTHFCTCANDLLFLLT